MSRAIASGAGRGVVRLRRGALLLLLRFAAGLSSIPLLSAQELLPRETSVPKYVQERLSPFGAPPDSADVARLLARWRAEAGEPGEPGRVRVAELWRRAGEIKLALAALPPERAGTPLAPWIALERARILFTAPYWRRDLDSLTVRRQREKAAGAFWRACRVGGAQLRRVIWTDIRGLATPEEQAEWREAGGDTGCEWIRRFLLERAWRSGEAVSDRLGHHYERLTAARRRYWLGKPRFALQAYTYLGDRPDSLELDDRGLVYLRMGKPDDLQYDVGLVEYWAYARPEGYWLYYFIPGQPTHDYRMAESFGPQARPGHDFYARYVTRMALDPYPLKQQIFHLFPDDEFDAVERRALFRQEQLLAREFGRRVVAAIPDAPEITPRVRLVVETLRFSKSGEEESVAWVLAAARAGDLRAEPSGTYGVRGKLVCLGPDGLLTREAGLAGVPAGAAGGDDALVLRIPLRLAPGSYPCTVVVRDEAADAKDRSGNWLQDTVVVPAPRPGLPALSDIAVAADSGGTWTRDGETFLRVSPAHVSGPEGFVHLYFEAYGVAPWGAYEVDLRLVPEAQSERVYELRPEDAAFSLRYLSEMPDRPHPIGPHHLRLDLRGTKPGRYLLAVRITDRTSGTRSLPATTWIERL